MDGLRGHPSAHCDWQYVAPHDPDVMVVERRSRSTAVLILRIHAIYDCKRWMAVALLCLLCLCIITQNVLIGPIVVMLVRKSTPNVGVRADAERLARILQLSICRSPQDVFL